MWKNIAVPDRPQMTIWCLRIARSLPKATDAHSEYAILIAFPQQQWLHEDASMLRYTYFASLIFPPSLAISSLSDHTYSFSLHLFLPVLSFPLTFSLLCIQFLLSSLILSNIETKWLALLFRTWKAQASMSA
jgi:hypothetical protein